MHVSYDLRHWKSNKYDYYTLASHKRILMVDETKYPNIRAIIEID